MITLCYHGIGEGRYATKLEVFEQHLLYAKKRGVFLTFDDATADFYRIVFPLLEKYELKALLAVPTAFISSNDHYCTWSELKEISQSPLIEIASHSHTHPNLTHLPTHQVEEEMSVSKKLIEDRLSLTPKTFVFPYGQFNAQVKKCALSYYERLYRLGTALNWGNRSVLYRIVADGAPSLEKLLSRRKLTKYFIKSFVHKLRGR